MIWLTTEPPKDDQFLADVGLPYAVVAAWNAPRHEFVYSNIEVDYYDNVQNDTYYENYYIVKIKKWMPLPEIDNG